MTTTSSATASPAALAGLRVLDLSRLVCGNTLTGMLADFGAEVVKVETPTGDTLRDWKVGGYETSWKVLARNKKSLCLDLRKPRATASRTLRLLPPLCGGRL